MSVSTRQLTPTSLRTPFARRHPVVAFLGSIVVCQLAGLIGLPFTDRGTDSWYDRLEKPSFNPPSAVFGPVWTTLYTLMGIALWLVLRKHPTVARRRALVLFGTQLALNAAWTPIFFGAEAAGPALAEIVVLLGVLGWTVSDFWKLDRSAGLLMLPYLGWVAFATVLNGSIVALN
jgi:translocator protein